MIYYSNIKQAFASTADFRPPRRGEWYLSGAIPAPHYAENDLSSAYYILRPITLQPCPTCKGLGQTEVPS